MTHLGSAGRFIPTPQGLEGTKNAEKEMGL